MSWKRILRAIEELAGGPEPGEGRWSETLNSLRTSGLFRELDVRLGTPAGIVVLTLDESVDLADCATAVKRLGPIHAMNVVSPPIRSPGGPGPAPTWDRRHSVCHVMGGRRVWFGLEKIGEVERLRSVAIHYGR